MSHSGHRLRSGTALWAPCVLALAAYAAPALADDCGRPAIFWISGTGSFDASMNFASAGGEVMNCAPQATDNVTFGAYPGIFPTSGTVSFAGGESVNSLLFASSGWVLNLGGNINVTQGLVFGNSSLTVMGGNSITASSTEGVLGGSSLIIPDNSGFSGSNVNLGSLSMTGGGSISVQAGSVGLVPSIGSITCRRYGSHVGDMEI